MNNSPPYRSNAPSPSLSLIHSPSSKISRNTPTLPLFHSPNLRVRVPSSPVSLSAPSITLHNELASDSGHEQPDSASLSNFGPWSRDQSQGLMLSTTVDLEELDRGFEQIGIESSSFSSNEMSLLDLPPIEPSSAFSERFLNTLSPALTLPINHTMELKIPTPASILSFLDQSTSIRDTSSNRRRSCWNLQGDETRMVASSPTLPNSGSPPFSPHRIRNPQESCPLSSSPAKTLPSDGVGLLLEDTGDDEWLISMDSLNISADNSPSSFLWSPSRTSRSLSQAGQQLLLLSPKLEPSKDLSFNDQSILCPQEPVLKTVSLSNLLNIKPKDQGQHQDHQKTTQPKTRLSFLHKSRVSVRQQSARNKENAPPLTQTRLQVTSTPLQGTSASIPVARSIDPQVLPQSHLGKKRRTVASTDSVPLINPFQAWKSSKAVGSARANRQVNEKSKDGAKEFRVHTLHDDTAGLNIPSADRILLKESKPASVKHSVTKDTLTTDLPGSCSDTLVLSTDTTPIVISVYWRIQPGSPTPVDLVLKSSCAMPDRPSLPLMLTDNSSNLLKGQESCADHKRKRKLFEIEDQDPMAASLGSSVFLTSATAPVRRSIRLFQQGHSENSLAAPSFSSTHKTIETREETKGDPLMSDEDDPSLPEQRQKRLLRPELPAPWATTLTAEALLGIDLLPHYPRFTETHTACEDAPKSLLAGRQPKSKAGAQTPAQNDPRVLLQDDSSCASSSPTSNPSSPRTSHPSTPSSTIPQDLYTPRWTRGTGKDKLGLCPICMPKTELWQKMKCSAYWYHLHYHHGVSAYTGRMLPAPDRIEFRTLAFIQQEKQKLKRKQALQPKVNNSPIRPPPPLPPHPSSASSSSSLRINQRPGYEATLTAKACSSFLPDPPTPPPPPTLPLSRHLVTQTSTRETANSISNESTPLTLSALASLPLPILTTEDVTASLAIPGSDQAKAVLASATALQWIPTALCGLCHEWVPLDSALREAGAIPEIMWWKHAQHCQKSHLQQKHKAQTQISKHVN